MYKKITFKSCMAIGFILLFSMCSNHDTTWVNYGFNVDVSNSTLAYNPLDASMFLYYSTDGGKTYAPFNGGLKKGQPYWVMIMDSSANGNNVPTLLQAPNVAIDWSRSNPKPISTAASGAAQFVFGDSNIEAVITCPYSASTWTGDWAAAEIDSGYQKVVTYQKSDTTVTIKSGDTTIVKTYQNHLDSTVKQIEVATYTSTNLNVVTAGSGTNTFVMNNFWGVGLNVQFVLTPSSSNNGASGTITIPQQTITDPAGKFSGTVVSESGSYDQCLNTFTAGVVYVISQPSPYAGTYRFSYTFQR